ncbi:MAG: glutathione transferase GstA [Alphaproteobacteria bacterium]
MKLYYSPGACSLSPHIILREAGLKFDLEKVDLKAKKTASGKDFLAINDKGAVPALEMDNGEVLSEGVAIVQYLASLKPETNLVPRTGSSEHFRLLEWLNYISTELHKGFTPLFYKVNDEADAAARQKLDTRLAYVAGKLKGKEFIAGNSFSVADAYLFTILTWAQVMKINLPAELNAYKERIAARPKVQEALQAEGLLNKAAA